MRIYEEDTIAAIATPLGQGGIGIVRVSGPLAEAIANRIFHPKRKTNKLISHRMYYGHIIDPNTKEVIDEVMAVLMRAPHTYTCEDIFEIHCHGGPLVLQQVLKLVIEQGARMAEPGEFTKRAFLNGRIDLTQAEAVLEMIQARTKRELSIATEQLKGYLQKRVNSIKDILLELKADLEVAIDFPEEDIEIVPPEVWVSRLEREAISEISSLLKAYDTGHIFREGAAIVIVGKPNVGKSSLLNCLLREERAIVTPIPGTTRDTIEEMINIKGIPLRIVDTAGLRKTTDEVETIGVRFTKKKLSLADLVLWVIDSSQLLDEQDMAIYDEIKEKQVILVLNKIDLPCRVKLDKEIFSKFPKVKISALYNKGIDTLQDTIYSTLLGENIETVPRFVPSLRHKISLERAFNAIKEIKAHLEVGTSPDLLAIDVEAALNYLGEIVGETTPEDVLDYIFSKFCIGK